jgi:hypothetical protein
MKELIKKVEHFNTPFCKDIDSLGLQYETAAMLKAMHRALLSDHHSRKIAPINIKKAGAKPLLNDCFEDYQDGFISIEDLKSQVFYIADLLENGNVDFYEKINVEAGRKLDKAITNDELNAILTEFAAMYSERSFDKEGEPVIKMILAV